jgi:pSer/pThr/pTyr-binding forkhead associated (FHA) protein
MSPRFVAIEEGPDITLDRAMVVVGRHPSCDTRLDSLRVSRHHCCMIQENGQVVVRDLGSANGIWINGQRVDSGRLRPGDELAIAHIRYRFEGEADSEPARPPARGEPKSAPDASLGSSWTRSPRWGFGPMNKG